MRIGLCWPSCSSLGFQFLNGVRCGNVAERHWAVRLQPGCSGKLCQWQRIHRRDAMRPWDVAEPDRSERVHERNGRPLRRLERVGSADPLLGGNLQPELFLQRLHRLPLNARGHLLWLRSPFPYPLLPRDMEQPHGADKLHQCKRRALRIWIWFREPNTMLRRNVDRSNRAERLRPGITRILR